MLGRNTRKSLLTCMKERPQVMGTLVVHYKSPFCPHLVTSPVPDWPPRGRGVWSPLVRRTRSQGWHYAPVNRLTVGVRLTLFKDFESGASKTHNRGKITNQIHVLHFTKKTTIEIPSKETSPLFMLFVAANFCVSRCITSSSIRQFRDWCLVA